MEDSKIIELFFERSEQAIVELSESYGKLMMKIAKNILRNRWDAEECVNDAYVGVWNTVPPEKPNPLRAYACRIVRNAAIKRYRRNTAKKRNSFYDVALEELADCIPSKNSVEEEMDGRTLGEFLNEFLLTLDEENRVMFVKRYWFAYSVKEIARDFGMNGHGVTVRLSRMREKLKKFLLDRGVCV